MLDNKRPTKPDRFFDARSLSLEPLEHDQATCHTSDPDPLFVEKWC